MKQGLYLLSPTQADENEIIARLNPLCARETPDAFLYDPANTQVTDIKKIIRAIQSKEIAFIVKDNVGLALACEADGVQIPYSDDIKKIRQQTEHLILGILCSTRDEAMRAGEIGADYVGFDGEHAADMTQWWSELFTVSCVDFNLDQPSAFADFRVQELNG